MVDEFLYSRGDQDTFAARDSVTWHRFSLCSVYITSTNFPWKLDFPIGIVDGALHEPREGWRKSKARRSSLVVDDFQQ